MHQRSIRVAAGIAVVLVTTLVAVDRASAAGAVLIDACQTLSDANTTYKLTTDLTSCDSCLIVANDKITIDLQGHSITSTCPPTPFGERSAITDQRNTFNVITIKNGFVSRYDFGVFLQTSTRVSVLAVTASNNGAGIVAGPQSLVKGSEAFRNGVGITVGPRGQVQQSNSHDNGSAGITTSGDNCLITANTVNGNGFFGGILVQGNRCTISFNTANNNRGPGISAGAADFGSGHLVTHNVALNNNSNVGCLGVSACLVNNSVDFVIGCPSTVTDNDSTNGFPASYDLQGPGCHTTNNN
jgi:Periplasmic copper-binding protein (NosD)